MGERVRESSNKVEVTLEDVRAAVAVLRAWLRQQKEVEKLIRDLRYYAGSGAYADPMKQIIAEAIAKQYRVGKGEEEEEGGAEIDETRLEELRRKAEELERMLKRA
jgi:predicted amidohydrolase